MQLSERLLSPESLQVQELIGNILRKKELLEANDPAHEEIRTALIVNGGGMRGAYAAAILEELERQGLTDVFDNVVGISAGSGTAAYFLSRQAHLGVDIYAQNFTQREFTNVFRPKSIVNVAYLQGLFAVQKPLDQTALRESRSNLYVGVTDALTAEGRYIEASLDPETDIIRLIQASASPPGISKPLEIDGSLYVDGVVGCKSPIDFAIEQLGATDVLTIVNKPLEVGEVISRASQLAGRVLLRKFPAHFRRAYLERNLDSDQHVGKTHSPDVRIGVLCPESMPLGRLSHNSQLVGEVALAAAEQVRAVFRATE